MLKRLILIAAILAPALCWGQADPLNAAYKPSIDCTSGDYPSNVSLSSSLSKLRQTADTPTSITGYGTTPLPCLTVYATQNEMRSFQVNVQAPGGGYSALTITMSNLVKTTGPGGNYTITSENAPPTFSSGSESSTTATFTTTAAHNFYAGQDVLIQNCTPTGYNGGGSLGPGVTLTSVGTTTFQFTTATGSLGTASGCSVTPVDILVYAEGYVTLPTASGPGSGGTTNTLFGVSGVYPDPLIPTIDPYFGQTTLAFPIAVTAGNNQSAWIDVHVPPSAPSGWYSGTVTIKNSGTTIATLPVLYAVWQWPSADGGFMPSTPTLRTLTFNGYDTLCKIAYGSSGETACDAAYPNSTSVSGNDGGDWATKNDLSTQLLDNRITLSSSTGHFPNGSPTGDVGLENGTSTGRVNRIMSSSKAGPVNMFYNFTSTNVASFVSELTTNSWFNLPNGGYHYLADEPGATCSNWTTPIANANSSRGWSTPNLPLLLTADYYQADSCSGLNALDWMIVEVNCADYPGSSPCGSPLAPSGPYTIRNDNNYGTWISGSAGPTRHIGFYTDCLPDCGGGHPMQYPSYFVDQFAPANEAMEWMSMLNSTGTSGVMATFELYYLVDNCFTTVNGCTNNPWTNIKANGVYGDGTLMYYGTNTANCATCTGANSVNVSIPIYLPSIRLKLWRDGVEDFEYMYLLNSLGGSSTALVQTEIRSWMTNGYTFNTVATAASGSFTGDMTDARVVLGNAVHQITFPAGGVTPVGPATTMFAGARIGAAGHAGFK